MDWIPLSKLGEGVVWPEDRVHWEAEPKKDQRVRTENTLSRCYRHVNTKKMAQLELCYISF